MDDNKVLQEINHKLNIIIGLISIQNKERDDQIMTLVGQGFSNKETGEILGIPKGTIDRIRAQKKK
ncbi:hypothetical protein KKF86_05255 [bacterium]|nr:hypothetical protein [bacterium]